MKAGLFDLDDTILASNSQPDVLWRATCETCAPPMGPAPLLRAILEQYQWYWADDERRTRGRLDLHKARAEIAARALATFGVDDQAYATRMAAAYHELAFSRIAPFDGAIEALHSLRARGMKLGLITNGASLMQRGKIDRHGLGPLFDVIVVEGEFGVGKPDPSVFTHALEKLGVRASEAWMVGDRLDWDVGPPQALGIHGIWNDFRREGLPEGSKVVPDRIIHSITELV